MFLFHSVHPASNPTALSVLHLSFIWTSGIDHLLFNGMKSSIPVIDLISFRKRIVAKDVYVQFSWFTSDIKTEGEELRSRN